MPPQVKEQTKLERAFDKAVDSLDSCVVGSKEYMEKLDAVGKLCAMVQDSKPKPDRVSADTAASIFANLLGIFMIIRYEKANVITTKAMSLLNRPRV